MKKLLFGAALVLSTFIFKTADAQLKISLNLNIGSQPEWGPTGYDHAEYYYMPDIDTYYDVPNHQYVYLQGSTWVHNANLPARYANYNLYNGYKVVVNQREPWRNQAAIRAKYASFKGRRGQPVIRDSRDNKYRNHWKGNGHDNGWHGDKGHDDRDRGYDDHGHH